jgi:hypothetical protein
MTPYLAFASSFFTDRHSAVISSLASAADLSLLSGPVFPSVIAEA